MNIRENNDIFSQYVNKSREYTRESDKPYWTLIAFPRDKLKDRSLGYFDPTDPAEREPDIYIARRFGVMEDEDAEERAQGMLKMYDTGGRSYDDEDAPFIDMSRYWRDYGGNDFDDEGNQIRVATGERPLGAYKLATAAWFVKTNGPIKAKKIEIW